MLNTFATKTATIAGYNPAHPFIPMLAPNGAINVASSSETFTLSVKVFIVTGNVP
ncbi:hypothetical protein D3C73_794640 [compost metagenome]